jgi:hypothetical protein
VVRTDEKQILTPELCLEMMQSFWREHTQAGPTREGVAMMLPLMYPDGWQVAVFLTEIAPSIVRISDHGKTLATLMETGLTLSAKITGEYLNERLRTFELQRDGFLLWKDLRLPLQGVDIQLFAEALVSISHLFYRHEPSVVVESFADKAVRQLFHQRNITARRNAEMEGALEQRIKVDYLVEAHRSVAIEVVNRRFDLLPYMEQWAFRWDDLRKRNKALTAAMVYDPEHQEWDATALRIGNSVCDVFCRYDEPQPLDEALANATR